MPDFEAEPIIHEVEEEKNGRRIIIAVSIVILLLGVGSGYLLYRLNAGNEAVQSGGSSGGAKKVIGSADTKTFNNSAEGVLEAGGVKGEGTHKLIRPGGESQTVAVTSSVVNLDELTGKKVKVWGQTFAAQKSGWLMDVGRVEILE